MLITNIVHFHRKTKYKISTCAVPAFSQIHFLKDGTGPEFLTL